MSEWMETQLPADGCPVCQTRLDLHSDPAGERGPAPGDCSVCLRCASLLRFDENMRLRRLTDRELEELPAASRRELWRVSAAVQASKIRR